MNRVVHCYRHRRCQRGSVIVTTAMTLLFLLGFVGIALSFGHMFIVKTELQTAMDSCALAATQELDAAPSAITRATNAGVTAGNLNSVNMQSATWSGQGKLVASEVTFRDTGYAVTTDPAKATYAQCQHTQAAVAVWLIRAMGAFAGNANAYSSTQNVGASAVATRAGAQTACPIPVALKPKSGGTAPDYGYQVGEWVTVYGGRTSNAGELGWYNIYNNNNYSYSYSSGSETSTELSEGGPCGTKSGDSLYASGSQTSVDTAWNYRFGIYKSSYSNVDPGPRVNHPDVTGYAYTSTNWKNAVPQNAYGGTPAPGSAASAANYLTKSGVFASFDDTGISVTDGSTIVYGNANQFSSGSFLATPGSTGQHANYGYKRRLVTIPIIDGTSKIIGFACMFMLDPMISSYNSYGTYGSGANAHLEYRGNPANATVPCTSSGLAGGTGGPLVSVLVR